MLSDRDKLLRRRGRPLLVELYRALTRLTSTVTVMNTGAHPDDEQSGMLAAMRFGYGMRVVVACSTRGEGGQNSLGPERLGALGVVRTRELEEAARVLDADVAWLGFGPDDPVHDFGFSKNGKDTLSRWGRERIVERLVRAYRRERPDIVIPTFLDVPGQHGHHRAMTEAAAAAVALAVDPKAYPEHFDDGLAPWQVAKFYLPAWSGGGGTYDDEVPPPNGTVSVRAPGRDPATGAAFSEIGQWSRLFHASQGMGHWQPVPQETWPLHLSMGADAAEADIRDGLPSTLGRMAEGVNPAAAAHLRDAEQQITDAIASFPDRTRIVPSLVAAAAALERVDATLTHDEHAAIGHRLARKRMEAEAAILVAQGVAASAWLDKPVLAPGEAAVLSIHVETGEPVDIRPIAPHWLDVEPIEPQPGLSRFSVTVHADAPLSDPWTEDFSSQGGNGDLGVRLSAEVEGQRASMLVDLDERLQIVPPHSVTLDPPAVILPLPASGSIEVAVRIAGADARLEVEPVPGLSAEIRGGGLVVTPDADLTPGLRQIRPLVDGRPAFRCAEIAYPHIGRASFVTPSTLDLLALDLSLPTGTRVGYVGGGADNVGVWLDRMGLDVTDLDEADLRGELGRFSTIVVGIFAFGLRPDLAAATPALHDWVERGGHLVTLYHRPSDGWSPDSTPPRRLVIGSPSLRWRVTDPAAAVEVLAPNHKLLNYPNHIGKDDWAGWNKERGLYFASEWDPAYEPLLAMHDAGEAPLKGALVSAAIGLGRHTHTSLVMHHQMDRMVPGAFRLMANLVQSVRR